MRVAAAVAAAAIAVAGCGGGSGEPAGGATLSVYVSLPTSGPAAPEGKDAADGARLALAEGPQEIDGYAIEARFLDAGAPHPGWTPARSAANARAATRDSTSVAYLGDFQSGATRASLPITNGARLLQVSPASGAEDLVAPSAASGDVPEVQHTGERSFGRVIPSDAAQADAAAAWADELGVGNAEVETDAHLPPYGQPGEDARYVTSAALDPADLPPAGQEFAQRFEDEYGRPPGRYAAYGYEAMAVILDSIERARDPADRVAVVEAFFDTADRDSVLGPYSITERGETTLAEISGYELGAGEPRPAGALEIP